MGLGEKGPRAPKFEASALAAPMSNSLERNQIVKKEKEICLLSTPLPLHSIRPQMRSLHPGLGAQRGKGIGAGARCHVTSAQALQLRAPLTVWPGSLWSRPVRTFLFDF